MDHIPSPDAVLEARRILRSLSLPMELVLSILEYARYFPRFIAQRKEPLSLLDNEWSLDASAAQIYLFSAPIPRGLEGEKVRVMEVKFRCKSHDQGWTTESTRGTFSTSSWFEASILRPKSSDLNQPSLQGKSLEKQCFRLPSDASTTLSELGYELLRRPLHQTDPQRSHCPEMTTDDEGAYAWYLQGNIVANISRIHIEHSVVWRRSRDGPFGGGDGAGNGKGFVERLREGDVVVVWARAKRRGWENHVAGMKIEIIYSF